MVISKTNEISKIKDFPKLMISEDGDIVLFGKFGHGVRVGGSGQTGYISACWTMRKFSDYRGEVTLRNS